MSTTVYNITILAADAGQRIDNFLRARLKGVPKSRLYKAVRKGEVRVNKKRVKAEYRLQCDDVVRIPPLRVTAAAAIPTILPNLSAVVRAAIIEQHPDFLVINKPDGLAVHRGSGVEVGLIDVLQHEFADQYLQLAHRLDRETSGCLVVARHRDFLTFFQRQLREGTVEKCYHALVSGRWSRGNCTIDVPLRRHVQGDQRLVRVDLESDFAKTAVTQITPLTYADDCTLLDIKLITGRTHQIRVHLAHYQHPVIGDTKYGDKTINATFRKRGLNRLALHASRIAFDLDDGERMHYQAELPQVFTDVIEGSC